jgi:hypothetical protein
MPPVSDNGEPDAPVEGEPPVDAGDAAQIKRRTTRAKLREQQKVEWLTTQMANPAGRLWLWGLLTDCGTFTDTFGTSPTGMPVPEATWFHAGARSVGLRLWKTLLKISPEMTVLMHTENEG